MCNRIVSTAQKMLTTGNSPRVRKWVLIATVVVSFCLLSDPAHALILDRARTALEQDLTNASFTTPKIIGIFFGLLEFILIAIPIGTGSMALANMNRGAEAWMPWITTMGGAIVFIAFIGVLMNQIYA